MGWHGPAHACGTDRQDRRPARRGHRNLCPADRTRAAPPRVTGRDRPFASPPPEPGGSGTRDRRLTRRSRASGVPAVAVLAPREQTTPRQGDGGRDHLGDGPKVVQRIRMTSPDVGYACLGRHNVAPCNVANAPDLGHETSPSLPDQCRSTRQEDSSCAASNRPPHSCVDQLADGGHRGRRQGTEDHAASIASSARTRRGTLATKTGPIRRAIAWAPCSVGMRPWPRARPED